MLLDSAKTGGKDKTTHSSSHTDQSGHYTYFGEEALRNQLKYRAVPGTQAKHGNHKQHQCYQGTRQVETDNGDARRRNRIHHQQRADSTDAISQRTAERTHQAAGRDAGSGIVACGDWVEVVLIAEIAGQGAGQTDKATEGNAVEKHEPPAVYVLQGSRVIAERLGCRATGSITC